jgi:hypothetical protein
VLVLAGDVGIQTHGLAAFRARARQQPVLYVPGNHEYYCGHLGRTAAARHGAPTWRIQQISGHTHDAFDYVVAGTRILCNPRGYDPFALNPHFDPARVVEV